MGRPTPGVPCCGDRRRPSVRARRASFAGRRPIAAVLVLGAAWLAPAHLASVAHALPSGEAPNDPLFRYQWHLQAIQLPDAWAVSRGAGATVAILDTGVAYENRGRYRRAPDLAGTRFVRGWDFVDGDAHPNDEPPRSRQSHGTHIAGIVAQTTNNALGAAGVAPKAAIMPVRVLKPDQSGSGKTIAKGLRYAADHGADVANLSLSGPKGDPALKAAVTYAVSKGVTIVAAAGNGGAPSVGFPGAYPEVIAVGAVGRDKTRASYSNYGEALDLVAPGGDGGFDAVGEPEEGVLQQTLKGDSSTFCYCLMASTSAAAAQVSGTAALLVGSGRKTSPAEVRSALLSSAQDLGSPGHDPEYGAGLVQAAAATAPDDTSPGQRSAAPPSGSRTAWLAFSMALIVALGATSLRRRRRTR